MILSGEDEVFEPPQAFCEEDTLGGYQKEQDTEREVALSWPDAETQLRSTLL